MQELRDGMVRELVCLCSYGMMDDLWCCMLVWIIQGLVGLRLCVDGCTGSLFREARSE